MGNDRKDSQKRATKPAEEVEWVQITAPSFCAAVATNINGDIVATAPILKRWLHCNINDLKAAVKAHAWKVEGVDMARDRGSRPTHYISVTAKVGKGKYEKGPFIGLWEGDGDKGPMFRGHVSGKYLDELYDFIKDYGEDSVGFAIFESRGDKGRRNRDEDDEDAAPRGRSKGRSSSRDDDDRGGRGKRGDDEDKGGRRGSRDKDEAAPRGRDKKKSSDWED